MSFFAVFEKMLMILLMIGLGALSEHLGYLDGDMDQKLSKLLLNFTMPAMILGSVLEGETGDSSEVIQSVLLVSVIFYGLSFLLALVVPKLLGGTAAQKGAWRYSLVFSNIGFIGYPVAQAIYGPGALFYAALLGLPFNLLSYSMGPLMLAGRGRFSWKQICSPCVLASVAALIFALSGIRLPSVLGESLNFVGSVTIPLSLLLVGSLLAGLPAGRVLASPRIWALSAIRLLLMPVLLVFCLRFVPVEPMIAGIAISQMGMPVAVNGTLLAMEYGGDTEALAQATFLTTVLSTITIPLIVAIFL